MTAQCRDYLANGIRHIVMMTAVGVGACSAAFAAQTATARQAVPTLQEPAVSAPGAVSASYGLSDLDAMTFGCPKAGLNAAAREAAKVPSQGTYQFSYFRIVNDSHHPSYEVNFKSNYAGEPDLNYCVSLYCQQGWDPKMAKPSVTLLGKERQPSGVASHGVACGMAPAQVKRPVKRSGRS